MKRFLPVALLASVISLSMNACAQGGDKGSKPSPAASTKETISSGATITINYSQPALKGRTIGKDVEPKDGQVWRAGANEATTFQVDKDVKIEGQTLPAGKYAFFTINKGDEWTLIFNKTWDTWGAYDYEKNKQNDALQVKVKAAKDAQSVERLTYLIDKSGKVTLQWGTLRVPFSVM
ncbi:DUF2911 domain-containing protein [Panacibacter sp. DH6]|uniref:DUF2911 domain-containing protein n=1 Tax=Panacibacter microcysteis TaxID=2793269 RepID=A0A931MC51_9BACT|nr:DUF2911 domain-containing protein [Panacibacter microcysteis]MBG9377887.1 DUF2911 domain-containing protein [Panacibacter microcysteis]